MDHRHLGQRLKAARERAGFTQEEAARDLGVSAAALSLYEGGKRGVDALLLERLARRYGVPVGFFFATDQPLPDWERALRTRAQKLSPAGKAGVSILIRKTQELADLARLLDVEFDERPLSPFQPLPDARMGDAEIAARADDARRYFDLGIAPLVDLPGFLEAQGALIFAVPFGGERDDLSGLFCQHQELGPIVVVNADQAYTRRPFTLAHEFAHCLFHYDRAAVLCRSVDQRPSEHFSDRFASLFLIPPAALDRRLREMRQHSAGWGERIVRLARYFGVSFKAMQHRLEIDRRLPRGEDLSGIQPVALAKSLGYETTPYEFGQRPLPMEERLPRVFLELVYRAVREGHISLQRGANLLSVSDIELEERLHPVEPDASASAVELYA